MSRKWINGRNVVLTGCSTGMGREITKLLVNKHGCNVVGIARNEVKLKSLKEELGDKFTYRRFDISDQQAWQSFKKELDEMGFEVDILINNAGMIQKFNAFASTDQATIDRINKVNYESLIVACSTFINSIIKRPYGAIVNIGSASSKLPVAGEAVYSATKCAVEGFTNSLYQELVGYGTYVTCIMPGPVKTDLFKDRAGDGQVAKKDKDNFISSLGMSAERAAEKIVGIIKRRKSRLVMGLTAKTMDISFRMFPRLTSAMTAATMRKLSTKIDDMKPAFEDQVAQRLEIKKRKKQRRKLLVSAKSAPVLDSIKNDKV